MGKFTVISQFEGEWSIQDTLMVKIVSSSQRSLMEKKTILQPGS